MTDHSQTLPITRQSIAKAYARIQPYIHQTPLLTSQTLNMVASSPEPRVYLSSSPPSAKDREKNGPSGDGNAGAKHGNEAVNVDDSDNVPVFNLFFKCENYQKIGAFKARGAFHALTSLIESMGIDEVRKRGVVTHSSGNHAQALALSSSIFKIPSYIVMPTISTPSKIAGTQSYTPNVIFSGSTSQEREAVVADVQKRTGAILVPPYDHPDIVLGQGTTGLEMEWQLKEYVEAKKRKQANSEEGGLGNTVATAEAKIGSAGFESVSQTIIAPGSAATQAENFDDEEESVFDLVVAPIGGGGLMSGITTWFSGRSNIRGVDSTSKKMKKRTLIVGAEPSFSGANDAQRSFEAYLASGIADSANDPTITNPVPSNQPGRIHTVKTLTIADGLRTPLGDIPYRILIQTPSTRLAKIFSVSETEIKWAMRLIFERLKVVVEPSGAVTLAVVLFCEEFRSWVATLQRQETAGENKERSTKSRPWNVGVVFSGGNTTMEAIVRLFTDVEVPVPNGKKASHEQEVSVKGKVSGEEESRQREIGQLGGDGKKVAENVAG